MIVFLISIIPQVKELMIPVGKVEVASSEVEAVFVPSGYEGPIVAAPWDESAF